MLISQTFPRRFATGEDIGTKPVTLPIARVTVERVGPTEKPVIWFFGARKGIVLGPALAREIAQIHGDDTDRWTRQPVTLYTVPVKIGTERHLRIRARAAQQATPNVAFATPDVASANRRHPVPCTPDPDAQRHAAQA